MYVGVARGKNVLGMSHIVCMSLVEYESPLVCLLRMSHVLCLSILRSVLYGLSVCSVMFLRCDMGLS